MSQRFTGCPAFCASYQILERHWQGGKAQKLQGENILIPFLICSSSYAFLQYEMSFTPIITFHYSSFSLNRGLHQLFINQLLGLVCLCNNSQKWEQFWELVGLDQLLGCTNLCWFREPSSIPFFECILQSELWHFKDEVNSCSRSVYKDGSLNSAAQISWHYCAEI